LPRVANSYFVVSKALTTIAYIAMAVLTWRFFRGRLDLPFAGGCTLLSACWCFVTRIKMAHFLQTYFDVFSRLELIIPSILGILLCLAALFTRHSYPVVHWVDGFILLCWIAIQARWYLNKKKYVKQGYGPVPIGTWVSPPASEMASGDLILTNGAVARRLHESVGHAATVVEMPDGMRGISSHMDRGCTLEPLSAVLGEVQGHYLLLKLAHPLKTPAEIERFGKLAQQMVDENQNWAKERNASWQRWVDGLGVSDALKERLKKAYRCTGYDWFGMFYGRLAPYRWTCIGASTELYKRAGIKTNPYGTGLLGFGTTLFDPIMPVRFLNDPAFVLAMEPKAKHLPGTLLFHDIVAIGGDA
jgi:hypothetical protein